MTTSGLVSAIHCLDFSKPENTRFQYGSSVRPLSIAAPIAGTWEQETPAMILATFRSCLGATLRCRLGRRLAGSRLALRLRLAAVALDRATARQHHLGIVVLGRAGHHRRHVLE